MTPWRGGATSPAGRAAWVRRFVLPWLLASCLGSLFLYLVQYGFLSRPLPPRYGDAFSLLRSRDGQVLPVVLLSTLAYLLLVGGAAAYLCIRFLHKFAGPVFKLRRTLREYSDGTPVKPLFFRTGDLVPELARAFNRFAERLRVDRQRWVGVLENADRLCLLDRKTCRAEMERALAELETLLSDYR